MDSNLPKGWVECKLGDILSLKNGYAFKSIDYATEGTSLIRISDIVDGRVDITNAVKIGLSRSNNDFIVSKGDILIAMSGATTGKFGVYENDAIALQNQRVGNFKPHSEKLVNKKFVYYLVHGLKKTIEESAYGGAQPNISSGKIEELSILLPPLPEQQRIVEKLDALMIRISNSKNRLEKIPALLKNFRQSVLAAAISGELTKDWREENKKIENSSDLLKRLIQVRDKTYKRQLEKAKKENSSKPRKPVLDIAILDDDFFAIPEKWALTNFESAAEKIFDGTHFSPKNYPEGEYKYITAKNIKEWGIDLSNITYVDEKVHKEIYSRADVKLNDILYIKDGATTGIATLNTLDEEFSLLSSVGVFRFNQEFVLAKYVMYFLNGVKQKMIANVSGVAITRLTLEKLKASPLIIPPFEEQKEIVRKVEELFHFADNIEARYQKAKSWFDKLPQSILTKAFRGELVPQNENDEPANLLLERIKEAKAMQMELAKKANRDKDLKKKTMKLQNNIDLLKELKSRFRKSKFRMIDFNDLLINSNYNELRSDFFEYIKNNVIEMSYDSKQKTIFFKLI